MDFFVMGSFAILCCTRSEMANPPLWQALTQWALRTPALKTFHARSSSVTLMPNCHAIARTNGIALLYSSAVFPL